MGCPIYPQLRHAMPAFCHAWTVCRLPHKSVPEEAVCWMPIEMCTVLVLRIAHRIWKETKQRPGTAGPDNMIGCCLVSFHFLWAILSTSTVMHPPTLKISVNGPQTSRVSFGVVKRVVGHLSECVCECVFCDNIYCRIRYIFYTVSSFFL